MLISEDAFKKDKWNITWNITDFRNIKNIKFKFIRGGITIIVGENNIGKTNILDYIYEENKEWDKFQVNKESYIEEETREGLIPSYRDPFPLFDLFFSRRFHLVYQPLSGNRFYKGFPSKIIHAFHPQFVEKPKESKMILSYKVYYFDLTASSSFLIKEKNKDLSLKRVKFRSCEIHYGKSEGGK